MLFSVFFFFFQAEDGIRDFCLSRGLGDVYKRQVNEYLTLIGEKELPLNLFEIIDIEDRFPVERVNNLLNDKE